MQFALITLFPDMFTSLEAGVTGRAQKEGIISLQTINPRDFTEDKHQSVDDHPYGGGPGMLMMPGPLKAALQTAKASLGAKAKTIFLSPQGNLFNQEAAARFASEQTPLILLSGRYEGIDERIISNEIDEEWSIGDYILTGGELAAMVMVDAITRLLPGVVGDQDSITQDSLTSGLLKYPQYTRPNEFMGEAIPPILLSGHHADITTWRLKASLGRTWEKRPDLLSKKQLSTLEKTLLAEYIDEFHQKNPRKSS